MADQLRIEGVFSVTVTPFAADGALDLAAFAAILRWHIGQGAAGLAIAADNGEASLLTITERQAMAETAVRVAGGQVPVLMGAMRHACLHRRRHHQDGGSGRRRRRRRRSGQPHAL